MGDAFVMLGFDGDSRSQLFLRALSKRAAPLGIPTSAAQLPRSETYKYATQTRRAQTNILQLRKCTLSIRPPPTESNAKSSILFLLRYVPAETTY